MLGLENLFAWFPWLIQWILSWLPKRGRLHYHEGGVKITGEKVKVLKFGTYWFNARWSEIYTDNIRRKVIELTKQVLTTKGGKRVRLGGVFIYHITNIKTWLVDNEDPAQGVQVEAERVLREWVKSRSFEDVQDYDPQKREDDDLSRTAQEKIGQYFGVWVRMLGIKDFAETNAMDLYHGGEVTTKRLDSVVEQIEEVT